MHRVRRITSVWILAGLGSGCRTNARDATSAPREIASADVRSNDATAGPPVTTTAVAFEDPHDFYTTASPNPQVRFYVENRDVSEISLRVRSVALKHVGESVPMTVRGVLVDDDPVAQPMAIAAGRRALVTVSLADPTSALASIHDAVEFALMIDANGGIHPLLVHVDRAIREQWHAPAIPGAR